jgi:hypothetical protein
MYALLDETFSQDIETFSPDEYLVGVLRRVIDRQQDVVISLDGVGEIAVRAARGDFYDDNVSNISAFCAAPSQRYQVRSMTNDERTRHSGRRDSHSIEELMWTAGFFASRGRLVEGAQFDVVRIRYWPNLTRLPQTPNTMRIIALLTRYPTSLAVAHRLLKIEKSEVFWVYSAARCAGLVQVVNAGADAPAFTGHRNKPLITQLLGRILRL